MNLHKAASEGKIENLKELIENGIDVNLTGTKGETALHHAADRRQHEAARYLIEKTDINIHKADNEGNTALFYAAKGIRPGMALDLIAAGADINATHENGSTALHRSVDTQMADICHALIENGANPNAANNDGATPLHIAAIRGGKEIIIALIIAGANTQARDNNGHTPLEYAVAAERTRQIIQYPLHIAAEYYFDRDYHFFNRNTFRALIEKGYDVNSELNGKTPLEIAIEKDKFDLAFDLLKVTQKDFTALAKSESKTYKHLSNQYEIAHGEDGYKKDLAKSLFGLETTQRAKLILDIRLYQYKKQKNILTKILDLGTLWRQTLKKLGNEIISPADVLQKILHYAGLLNENTDITCILEIDRSTLSIELKDKDINAQSKEPSKNETELSTKESNKPKV